MLTCIALFCVLASISGCAPNRRIADSVAATPEPVNAAPVVVGFEADLLAMRNADFKFILVFRRKDNGVMDAEDKAFLNANTPYDVNRRRLSDNDKAIIIGTNFPFLPGMTEKLATRFEMENHSKADSGALEQERPGASPVAN